jgi:hypothetical protein
LGIDASSIARPRAITSPDRSAQALHNLPGSKKVMTPGWQFSTMVVLPEQPSSWTYVLSQRRISSQTTAIELAMEQLRQLVPMLPA